MQQHYASRLLAILTPQLKFAITAQMCVSVLVGVLLFTVSSSIELQNCVCCTMNGVQSRCPLLGPPAHSHDSTIANCTIVFVAPRRARCRCVGASVSVPCAVLCTVAGGMPHTLPTVVTYQVSVLIISIGGVCNTDF